MPHESHCTGFFVVKMVPQLSKVQLDTAEVVLLCKVVHADVAEVVKCSIPTVKWISCNLKKYDHVHSPKLMQQSHPPILTREMIDIYPFFIPCALFLCRAISEYPIIKRTDKPSVSWTLTSFKPKMGGSSPHVQTLEVESV
jgi:hypothetical protein